MILGNISLLYLSPVVIIIITDIYKAPFLSRAHSDIQIYATSTMHNTQTTIASNHM